MILIINILKRKNRILLVIFKKMSSVKHIQQEYFDKKMNLKSGKKEVSSFRN